MNPNTISELKAESAKHKELALKLDEIIAHYEGEGTSSFYATSQYTATGVLRQPQHKGVLASLAAMSDWSRLPQAEVCFLSLLEAGHALTREQIVKIASNHNKWITSPDHLSPILSRDSRFDHLGKGVWDLKSRKISSSGTGTDFDNKTNEEEFVRENRG